jgi:hypothetical protein
MKRKKKKNENEPKGSLLIRMQTIKPNDTKKAEFVGKYYRQIANWCKEDNHQIEVLYHKSTQSGGYYDIIFSVEKLQKNKNNFIEYIEFLKKYYQEFYKNIQISVIDDNRDQVNITIKDIHFSAADYCIYTPTNISINCNCIPFLTSNFNDFVVSTVKAVLCFTQIK